MAVKKKTSPMPRAPMPMHKMPDGRMMTEAEMKKKMGKK